MAIFELYSKRQKKLRGEMPDVYQYDYLPTSLRVQIVHIIRDVIGFDKEMPRLPDKPSLLYEQTHNIICREYGVFFLSSNDPSESYEIRIHNFILQEDNIEKVFDIIELIFETMLKYIKKNIESYNHNTFTRISPDDALSELNYRFKEHGVGFQFENGKIMRVDSTYMHSEVVKPSLKLLFNKKFRGANDEYLSAFEHYRHGKNKECLADCLKAFESTMKIICKEKGWAFNETDTSKKLINICFQNGLVPNFTQNQFSSLRNLLESGIPTIRNKLGGHGQGQIPQKVDDEMARYALNLTGANIIFLVEQSGVLSSSQ